MHFIFVFCNFQIGSIEVLGLTTLPRFEHTFFSVCVIQRASLRIYDLSHDISGYNISLVFLYSKWFPFLNCFRFV